MTELSRKEKLRLLLIKNKRKSIINEFAKQKVNLTLESFYDVDYSINLMEQLFVKIDRDIDYKDEYKFHHNSAVVKEKLSKIKSMISPTLMESEVLLYHLNFRETGAVSIALKDALKNIEWIVDFTGYPIGRMDFIIIDSNLNFGLCVERWEYQDTFIHWGLFS